MAKVEALDVFMARKAEIDRLLARLTVASADHYGVAPEEVHWGHVGSLEYQVSLLQNICEFIGEAAEVRPAIATSPVTAGRRNLATCP